LSASIGIWIGVWTAARQESRLWKLLGTVAFAGYSIPSFWLGVVLVLVFGVHLGWVPIVGMSSVRMADSTGLAVVLDVAHHMILPVVTLTAYYLAFISRVTRASMLEALQQDYVV